MPVLEELGLLVRKTEVGAQKVDGTILSIYGMVVMAFLVMD